MSQLERGDPKSRWSIVDLATFDESEKSIQVLYAIEPLWFFPCQI